MSNTINVKAISFRSFKKFLKKLLANYIFFVVILLFIGGYVTTFFLFSSDYIFNDFIPSNGYSRGCIKVVEEDTQLLYDMKTLYNNHKSKSILPIYFINMPKQLKNIPSVEDRKQLFINIILPILLQNYDATLKEREALLYINNKLLSRPLVDQDFLLIKRLAFKYKVPIKGEDFWDYTNALDQLLIKVDVVPMSLALAVAAKETGWGTSRFLLEGNSLFSEWRWDNEGIIPKQRSRYKKYSVKKFRTLARSVASYYYNLNTNKAYVDFRLHRASQRNVEVELGSTGKLEPNNLARQLFNYSNDPYYAEELIQIMRKNHLYSYDSMPQIDNNYNKMCFHVL